MCTLETPVVTNDNHRKVNTAHKMLQIIIYLTLSCNVSYCEQNHWLLQYNFFLIVFKLGQEMCKLCCSYIN